MNKKSKAYILSLSLYLKVAENGQMRKITLEQYSERQYERVQTEMKVKYQPEDLTVIDSGLFSKDWSAGARDLLCRITSELYMNNTLWFFHPQTSRQRQYVAELRKAGVLLRTEDAYIHYVNPDHIRKGSKPSVLILTTKELEGVTRVTRTNIRPLMHTKKQHDLSLFEQALLLNNLNFNEHESASDSQTQNPDVSGGDS